MANKPTLYTPAPQPEMPGSDRQYLREELRKLEAAIRELLARIEALEAP